MKSSEPKNKIHTKYPIVLVHGIALKDIAFFKAFGRIEKVLRSNGCKVFTAKTDGFGTIENNATQLKIFTESIIATENCDKVNIIAHSKGGLDAVHMISKLDMTGYVASLTTLCTPHKGSPIATKLLRLPKPIVKFIAFWVNLWYRIFGDKHPNALEVCKQLKLHDDSEYLTDINGVYCQSYSTTLEKSRDDFIMGIPLYFSKHAEAKPSDGLVSAESAMFGEYKGDCIDSSVSHSEIVDFMVRKSKKDRIYSFYLQLCEELAQKGF